MKEKRDKKEQVGIGQLTLTFLRHSHKGVDGNLDEMGIQMAKDFDISTFENSKVEVYSSGIWRSIETGKIIGGKLKISPIIIDPILSENPYTDEKIEKLGLSGGKWLLVDEANRLLAAKIARFTLGQIEARDRKSQIIAISHVPPIMAFLGYVLAFNKGKNSIDQETQTELFESFGGKFDKPAFVKPLEGFELIFDNDNNDTFSINFAGHNLQLPIIFLEKLNK